MSKRTNQDRNRLNDFVVKRFLTATLGLMDREEACSFDLGKRHLFHLWRCLRLWDESSSQFCMPVGPLDC